MIEYQRDDATRRLYWIAREVVTLNDVLEVTSRRATEGAWSYRVLYDARQRTGSLTLEQLRELNQCVAANTSRYGPRGAMAIVTAPKADGIRRVFSMIGRALSADQRVFTRVPDADHWLGHRPSPGAAAIPQPKRSAPPCPRCRSTETRHTHEHVGERVFFCVGCKQTWGLRPGTLTSVSADAHCDGCGGLLVPPQITGFNPPPGTDYVCLRCGRPYRWVGHPPRLTTTFTR
jgi:hypothetical protein